MDKEHRYGPCGPGRGRDGATGSTIGASLLLDFPQVTGSKVRLNILSSIPEPSIWNVKVQFANRAYRLWREAHFGPGYATDLAAQDTADPDLDGLPNILEYSLDGYDPLVADPMPAPTQVSANERNYVEYRLDKRPSLHPGVVLAEFAKRRTGRETHVLATPTYVFFTPVSSRRTCVTPCRPREWWAWSEPGLALGPILGHDSGS